MATRYFRRKWVPLLGPALSWLIIALRQHCYWNRSNGEKRDWCLVTQEELAQEIGISSKTVRRQLQQEHAGRFVVEVKNRYDGNPGKRGRRKSLYRIRMSDPLVPEDGERFKDLLYGRLAACSFDPRTARLRAKRSLAYHATTPMPSRHDSIGDIGGDHGE